MFLALILSIFYFCLKFSGNRTNCNTTDFGFEKATCWCQSILKLWAWRAYESGVVHLPVAFIFSCSFWFLGRIHSSSPLHSHFFILLIHLLKLCFRTDLPINFVPGPSSRTVLTFDLLFNVNFCKSWAKHLVGASPQTPVRPVMSLFL